MSPLSSPAIRLRRTDAHRDTMPVESTAENAAAPQVAATNKVHLAEHPLAQHALMALRNKHTAPLEFRQVSHQLLVLLVIEATRTLPTRDEMVQTHSTTHTGAVLAKPVVLLSITREGLGLAHQAAQFIPDTLVGTISFDRNSDNQNVQPRLHLVNAPALGDVRVILFVPVIASGLSASQALNYVRRAGATDITLISFLVSFQGLTALQNSLPNLNVWTAGIDSDWNSKRGPLPGLGNFAERLYG